jgi:hypothetical protein
MYPNERTYEENPAVGPKLVPCKCCGTGMIKHAVCGDCGWRRGLVPVAQNIGPGGQVSMTFMGERRRTWMVVAGVLSTLLGLGLAIGGLSALSGGQPQGLLLALAGVAITIAGIATCKITEGGKVWEGLTPSEKALAIPGIICGSYLVFAVIAGWILSHMFDRS